MQQLPRIQLPSTLTGLPADLIREIFSNNPDLYSNLAAINQRFRNISQDPRIIRKICTRPIQIREIQELADDYDQQNTSTDKFVVILSFFWFNNGDIQNVNLLRTRKTDPRLRRQRLRYEFEDNSSEDLDEIIQQILTDNGPKLYLYPRDEYEIYRHRIGCVNAFPNYAKDQTLRHFDHVTLRLNGENLNEYLTRTLSSVGVNPDTVPRITPLMVRQILEERLV